MIIKISSTNSNLLDILNRNPNTDEGLYLKPLANGVLIGNCISPNQYDIVFVDSKYSFTNFESNLLDFKSFCDGRVVLKVLSEFFNHLFNFPQEEKIAWLGKSYKELDTQECTFFIENLWIDSNYVKNGEFFLSKYFDGFTLTAKGKNVYSLSFTGTNILETFNVISLTAFLLQMVSNEPLFLDEGLLSKYIRILGNTPKAPYFIYYLLSKRLGSKYSATISVLENNYTKNFGVPCSFTPNDTQTDRIHFIRKHLDFDNSILDYGCGEFAYLKSLAKKIKTPFYSYDKEDYSELYGKLKERYKDKDWKFTTDLSTVPSDVPLSVIISEMIEHEDIDESVYLIRDLVITKNIKQIVLTTPNVGFNKYYNLDTFRHPDHKQELTRDKWLKFIYRIRGTSPVEFFDIGDWVDGECVTFGAVINYG